MSPRIGLDVPTIVRTAAEIANTQGLEAVTMASLSQKLGIRSPSLYNHIDGLSGVKLALAIYGLREMNEQMSKAVEGLTGEDAVYAAGKAYVAFARSNPGVYEATIPSQSQDNDEFKAVSEQLMGLIINLLDSYKLKQEMAIHIVRGLRSLLHGFSSIEQKGGFGLPYQLDESMQLVLQTYLSGIQSLSKED
ncbi:WHG domain-containing protein [Paenibacillus algorifonticola]|uniref:TetR-like C-terminal domain-containing protein n=1 Tax=Paenibacillus algorifonticola TaxID=684063 RepID=UPI003D289C52